MANGLSTMSGAKPRKIRSRKSCYGAQATAVCAPMNLLTKESGIAILRQIFDLIRVTARFFSGVLHPHLLGVCCPNLSFFFGE
jgi:hypothetical protein